MASSKWTENQGARQVLVVSNPGAGAGGRQGAVRDLVTALMRRGLLAQIITDLDTLTPLADSLLARGELRAVVAAGGDGTVAEVVNRTAAGTPITVFPLGTANLLAGYFSIACDAEACAATVQAAAAVRLDAGQANGRVFLLMAGCGFDADVVQRLHRRRQGGNIRYWTWLQPIAEALRSYRYPLLRIYVDAPESAPEQSPNPAASPSSDETLSKPAPPTLTARWAFVVNLPSYAVNLQVAPDAVGNDGKLDICAFIGGSLWHAMRYIGLVALRQHRRLSDFRSVLGTRVRIEADEPVPYQLDGDPGGMLPLEIEVLPGRLTFVAPEASLRTLGLHQSPSTRAGV